MISAEALSVLRERHTYLGERIKAKRVVGWETQWDEREHEALGEAIEVLEFVKRNGFSGNPVHVTTDVQTPIILTS